MTTKTFTFTKWGAGASVYFRVFDGSGQVLDFDDNAFKSLGGATTPYVTATERADMGGTGQSGFQASIDLANVNNTPTRAEYYLQAYEGSSPADSDRQIGNARSFEVRFGEFINGNSFVEVQTEISVKSTSGTTAQVTAWLEHNGNKVDLDAYGGTVFTADDTTDVCTSNAHGLSDGDALLLTTSNTLPDPLVVDTVRWVRDKTTNTFKLAASSGGAAIDITDTGTGTHKWHKSTASVTLREHGSGGDKFSTEMTLGDVNSNVFEAEQATPAFTDDRQYDVIGSITIEGETFTTEDNRVVIG